MAEIIAAPLRGKVALVTGGSSGIGQAIAKRLAEQGCSHLAITYHSSSEGAKETLATCQAVSPNVRTFSFRTDINEPHSGQQTVNEALSGLNVDHVDIVVACAAFTDVRDFVPAEDLTKLDFDKHMTSNAWSPLTLATSAIHHMPRGGRIIFMSSAGSRIANPRSEMLMYAASKSALEAISRSLAALWTQTYGVTVNSISTGPTQTPAVDRMTKRFGPASSNSIAACTLRREIALPEEVAEAVAFVASPGASYISGSCLPVNGGMLVPLQG